MASVFWLALYLAAHDCLCGEFPVVASFSTVSLVKETSDIIKRFANWYRSAGASEVFIYHDGPAPEMTLGAGVVLVECDDAFWADLCGSRPAALEDRQSAVFAAGLAKCRSDWLLVVDADEFVFGNRAIPEFLDAVPPSVDAISLPTAEAVWGPGDELGVPFGSTHFRMAWPRGWIWRRLNRLILADMAHHLQRGVTGHTSGKEFIRASKPYSLIKNHVALRDGVLITRRAGKISPELRGMFLGHYDAIGLADGLRSGSSGSRRRHSSLICERRGANRWSLYRLRWSGVRMI